MALEMQLNFLDAYTGGEVWEKDGEKLPWESSFAVFPVNDLRACTVGCVQKISFGVRCD
jgi:hypothetical protein